jgi:hypothetical protein
MHPNAAAMLNGGMYLLVLLSPCTAVADVLVTNAVAAAAVITPRIYQQFKHSYEMKLRSNG